MGSRTFQPNRMSWSYRNRGKVARNQKNKNKNTYTFRVNQMMPESQCRDSGPCKIVNGACHPPKNNTVATQDTRIILAYSARKKNANRIPLYSVKNPATNSLSASGKSKGTRFVSATEEIRKTTKAMAWGKAPPAKKYQFQNPPACALVMVTRLKDPARSRTPTMERPTFNTDQLCRRAQASKKGIFTVGGPPAQNDAIRSNGGKRQNIKNSDVNIGNDKRFKIHPADFNRPIRAKRDHREPDQGRN